MQGDIIDLKNFILQENGHITCCVSEVLIPRDYKTKEEWFAKVRSVWKETYMQMENSTEEKEVCSELPRRWEWCFLLTDRLRTCSILAFMW